MVLRLVIWNLADSQTNVGELRRYLRDEAVPAFEQVPGLLFKGWFSDEVSERWGAVYVWESQEAFAKFGETLVPIMADLGADPGQPMVSRVHNVIEG